MKTNYLNICPLENISKNDDVYIGHISPKNYKDWSKSDPLTLFFEGIHQFCVRISFLFSSNSLSQSNNKIKIPAKIKILKLSSYPSFDNYLIEGVLRLFNDTTLVTFTAYNACEKEVIATGEIYISNINR